MQKILFLKNVTLHGFHGNIGDFKEGGVPVKILISKQQLILEHSTWYQITPKT